MNQMKLCLAGALLAVVAICITAQTQDNLIPSPSDGQNLYARQCAGCHASTLKGHTERSPSAPDLTTITQRHGGKFVKVHVTENILNRDALKPMPCFDTKFTNMYQGRREKALLAVSNLSDYIQSHQAPR